MEKVKIKQITHNQNNIVLFDFKKEETLIETFKQQIQHFHWNQELQAWMLPTKEEFTNIFWKVEKILNLTRVIFTLSFCTRVIFTYFYPCIKTRVKITLKQYL